MKKNISFRKIYFLCSSILSFSPSKTLYSLFILLLPSISFAAGEHIRSLLLGIKRLIDLAIPITFGLGLIFFFWGMGQFILKADSEDSRKKGKQFMIYAVLALFVMSSVWGLVKFIGDTLGIRTPVQSGSSIERGVSGSCAPEGGDLTNCI